MRRHFELADDAAQSTKRRRFEAMPAPWLTDPDENMYQPDLDQELEIPNFRNQYTAYSGSFEEEDTFWAWDDVQMGWLKWSFVRHSDGWAWWWSDVQG